MATTGTKTVSAIVTAALRKMGVTAADEPATAADMANGVEALEMMLKSWQREPHLDWTVTSGSVALTTGANHTLSPVRPIRIVSARYKGTGGNEIPMVEMTRDQYDSLPNKTSTGVPTQFYYDRQREAAVLYVWPVMASVTTETIEYTYQREIEDIAASTDTVDIPGEWYECAVYNLADRMMIDYEIQKSAITARAEYLWRELVGAGRPESVFFNEV